MSSYTAAQRLAKCKRERAENGWITEPHLIKLAFALGTIKRGDKLFIGDAGANSLGGECQFATMTVVSDIVHPPSPSAGWKHPFVYAQLPARAFRYWVDHCAVAALLIVKKEGT